MIFKWGIMNYESFTLFLKTHAGREYKLWINFLIGIYISIFSKETNGTRRGRIHNTATCNIKLTLPHKEHPCWVPSIHGTHFVQSHKICVGLLFLVLKCSHRCPLKVPSSRRLPKVSLQFRQPAKANYRNFPVRLRWIFCKFVDHVCDKMIASTLIQSSMCNGGF